MQQIFLLKKNSEGKTYTKTLSETVPTCFFFIRYYNDTQTYSSKIVMQYEIQRYQKEKFFAIFMNPYFKKLCLVIKV